MREWALWLKVLLVALVLGVVALAAATASLFLGLSLVAAGALFAGMAAVLGVTAPFLIGHLFPGGEPSVGDPRRALNPPYATLPRKIARANPNLLLHPEYEAAPFRGRDKEFGLLLGWCASDPRSGLALISGPAGIGKTRLAAELCRSQANAGWLTGFLKADPSPASLAGIARLRRPTLVVVDDAEGRVDQILRLLGVLLDEPPRKPWRIVLLARWKGDWWSHLHAKSEETQAEPLVASTTFYEPSDVDPTEGDRRDALRAALASFGKLLGMPTENLRVPHLDSRWGNGPLFLQMSALSTICAPGFSGAAHARHGPITRDSLLTDALDRERRYWRATSAEARIELGDDGASTERAVVVATLVSARNEDEAEKALCAVPDLASHSEGTRRLVARWLRNLYPGAPDEWFKPLKPDLLGEAHVAAVLRDVPVGAEQAQPVVGPPGTGGPDLGAVDHPLVSVANCRREGAGDVGASARLGEELHPELLASQHRRDVLSLLLLGAELQEDRATRHERRDVEHTRHLVRGTDLVECTLVRRAEPLAAAQRAANTAAAR